MRSVAETTPTDSDCFSPNGDPIAATGVPTWTSGVRSVERQRLVGQPRGVDLEQRDVGVGVVADHLRRDLVPSADLDVDLFGRLDVLARSVGDDLGIGGHIALELYARDVIVVQDRDPAGGYLGSRLKKIDQILQSEPNAVWLNQYANMANKNVHAEQTANEIAREFDKLDWIFVGAGTTGTLAGVSERLRHEFPGNKGRSRRSLPAQSHSEARPGNETSRALARA